jgi:GNAT superfamily N-acetyltransferase
MRFHSGYREEIVLDSGTSVTLRLLHAGDRKLLAGEFDELSPRSRYQRFMTAMPKLPASYLDALACLDSERNLAIGAIAGERLVGSARIFAGETGPAEVGIEVIDRCQGQGVGRNLLRRLLEAAAERGFCSLIALVLRGNRVALELFRSMDWRCSLVPDGCGTIEIELRRC